MSEPSHDAPLVPTNGAPLARPYPSGSAPLAAAFEDADKAEIDLAEYVAILWRRWRIIVGLCRFRLRSHSPLHGDQAAYLTRPSPPSSSAARRIR